MSGYALYKNDQGWYWVENDVQFGPYEEYWHLQQEKFCVIGSIKHTMLTEGVLKPRVGDFVKSRLTGRCGLVTVLDVHHYLLGYGVVVGEDLMSDDFLSYDDMQWIAPFEWDS